ncbi:MBL fold metallo-hydrolase [Gracilibacillus dipsosauri]|uniref:MBL fold metallo-hydrolase n=1 Tax=Gracilibacillus dipsosauri TaxID=178340 RepID=UPI0006D0FBA1
MKLIKRTLGELQTNCYILQEGHEAIIFDPAGEPEKIISYIEKQSLKPLAILLTHSHFDHIGALEEIRQQYKAPVYVHPEEKEWLQNPELNGSLLFFGQKVTCRPAEYVVEERSYTIGPFQFDVFHTPGHSPGGVAFIFHQESILIGGDSLFREGIGRTDLPGGDIDELIHSIEKKLFLLPEEYLVYPGHGPETSIGYEKQNNPFLQ